MTLGPCIDGVSHRPVGIHVYIQLIVRWWVCRGGNNAIV